MRRLGLIGGMSPESTAAYYRMLVDGVAERLGGFSSPDLVIHSLDFARVRALQAAGDWDGAAELLIASAEGLQRAGAEALLIATNTMHVCAPALEKAVPLPLIHIADATGAALISRGCRRPALLGTRVTMEMGFYAERLQQRHGLEVWTPPEAARTEIDRIIFAELVKGDIRAASREAFRAVAEAARAAGADSVILGCTEIGLLVDDTDLGMPTVCTARAHVDAALDFMLS